MRDKIEHHEPKTPIDFGIAGAFSRLRKEAAAGNSGFSRGHSGDPADTGQFDG